MSDAHTLPDSVLLVDDEPTILKLLTATFTRAGLKVTAVDTAEAAIEALDVARFGAVVTDKNLPGKSGLDVIRATKEKQPYCATVMITGYVSTQSALEALKLGANDYLTKPFEDVGLVAQRVKMAIASQRVEAERATLADLLKEMAQQLRAKEDIAFQHATELDLFTNVMDLRIEEAKAELVAKVEEAAAAARSRDQQLSAAQATLRDVSLALRQLATGEAKEAVDGLASRLDAVADALT